MTRPRRGPWARRLAVLGLAVLVVVVALLLLHLVIMGSTHHEDAGCATCLAILAVGFALVMAAVGTSGVASPVSLVAPTAPRRRAGFTAGRHPPPLGVVLRL